VGAAGRRIIAELSIGEDGKLLDKVNLPAVERTEDPYDVASAYTADGIGELLFRAVGTSFDALTTLSRHVASSLQIPCVFECDATRPEPVGTLLDAGASCVIIQGAALRDPDHIALLARSFGPERIAVNIAASGEADGWRVLTATHDETEWSAVTWARVAETQGAGSVFLGSAGRSATSPAFDLALLELTRSHVAIPVIARGSAERVEDLFDALMIGNADGVVVGELLHSGRATVPEIKAYLMDRGLGVWEVGVNE